MAEAGKGDPRWIVEAREDGTNVNNWHWTEKNANKWAEDLWTSALVNLKVTDDNIGEVTITELSKFEGDVTLSNRKGKVISYYEVVIEVKWEAKHENGEDKASGTLKIPNISEENDPDDIEVEVSLKKTTPYGTKAKDLLRKKGLKDIQRVYGEFKDKLFKEYSQGMIKAKKGNKMDGNAAAAAKVSVELAKQELKGIDIAVTGSNAAKESTSSVSHNEDLDCGPNDLYACFTVQDRFCAFTGSNCDVKPTTGSDITLCNGYLKGKFLELEENKKIVLEMRQENWPAGVISKAILEFKFKADAGCTKFMVTQTGIPKSKVGECAARWKEWCGRIRRTFGFGASPLL